MTILYAPEKDNSFMARLGKMVLEASSFGVRVSIERNEFAYSSGCVDQNIYLLESGQLKTVMFSRGGKECLLRICRPGDVFGEQGVRRNFREDSAIAMQDSVMLRMSYSRFIGVITEEGLIEDFVAYLANRISEQQHAITNFVTVDSEQRLGDILLDLADRLGQGDPCHPCIEQRITHQELASMVGTTRTRIGSFLKNFQNNGLINVSRTSGLTIYRQRLVDYLSQRYG